MLPIYARMVDEERGLLRHICDWGIQPELDEIYSKIRLQEYFYDPDHPASWGHLDWLGQFVGLGILDGHWLGVGLKPTWSIATKIDVIKRAWKYWQIKGSEAGIREAIAMWLRFEDKKRLLLNLPFGTTPTDEPPNWHGWNTPYDVSLNQTFPEKQRLGWGNYWGNHHRPDYFTLQADWAWEWGGLVEPGDEGSLTPGEPWQDRVEDGEIIQTLNYVEPPDIYLDRSRMGDRELWMHFYLQESEWNRIFPDIFDLNLEILPITTTATVFGWLQGIRQPAIQPLIQTPRSVEEQTVTEFEFDGMQWGQLMATEDWHLPANTWAYAGTLWSFDVADPYTSIETVKSQIEWGMWDPEWWDGQPWGTVIGERANHESLSITVNLEPVPTLKGETLSISTKDLPYYTEIAPTYWYSPWEERTITETITVQHPGTGCLEGIPIKFDSSPDTLTISLGRSLASVTNQLLVPYEEEGAPKVTSSEETYQETLTIYIPRPNAGGFYDASAEEVPEGDWIEASFLRSESTDVSEPNFESGYAEQSVPVPGFKPATVFRPEQIQVAEAVVESPVTPILSSSDFQSAAVITETEEEQSVPLLEFERGQVQGNYPVLNGFENASITQDLSPSPITPSIPVSRPVTQPVEEISSPATDTIDFEAGSIEGFERARTQGNYPITEGFDDANFGVNEFDPEPTLTGETLSAGVDDPPRVWISPTTRIQMGLEEPILVATYNDGYENYPYYYDSGFDGDITEVAVPIETLSINTSEWNAVETLSATPEIDGYLCNVFGGWSSLTPTNVNQYKLEIQEGDFSIFDAYPLLAQASDGEQWKLLVETTEEYYILQPVTMFWKKQGQKIPVGKDVRRSQIFSFEEKMTDLYLEFVFQPKEDTYIQSASLSLAGKLIQHQNYYYKLNAPDEARIGFVFDVPFRLPSGAGSPQEEVLLEEILPNLTTELLQLAGLPTTSGLIPTTPVITTLPSEPAVDPESLTEILRSLRDLIRDKGGDKHFPHTIETLSLEVRIDHNLGKYPSVTYVDTVDGEGNKSYGDVRYIDRNTIVISFTEPTIGRVFCN